MAIGKRPTPDWPSTDCGMVMLVRRDAIPVVSANASILQGSESVFVLIDADDLPKDRARHHTHFSLIGSRDAVLDVIRQLRAAVDAAQPSAPEE